jgi:RNA polymerase sigma-70 factor (ECF subfamily)
MKKQSVEDSKIEDEQIIKQIIAGDKNKFAVLRKKYYYLVYSLVKKMINDHDDAEDIMQESFVKAYNSLDSFNAEYSFSS